MKKTIALLVALCSLAATAQERVMTVRMNNGNAAAYPVKDVERVTFDQANVAGNFTFFTTPTDSRVIATVMPNSDAIYYYYDLTSKSTYDSRTSDQDFMDVRLEYLVNQWNTAFDQGYSGDFASTLTNRNSTYTFSNLYSETTYVLYAFEIDPEEQTASNLQAIEVTTTATVISDNCTFSLEAQNISGTGFDIKVTPSNADTRYYVGVVTKELASLYTPDQLAAGLIQQEDGYGIDWAGDSYIYTGTQTLNTQSDLNIEEFTPETEYTVVVFGVDKLGSRTTAVQTLDVTTTKVEKSNLTFSFETISATPNGLVVRITPSNNDEVYFFEMLPKEEFDEYESALDAATTYTNMYASMGYVEYVCTSGVFDLDMDGYCDPSTTYVVMVCAYKGGQIAGDVATYECSTPAASGDAPAQAKKLAPSKILKDMSSKLTRKSTSLTMPNTGIVTKK